MQTRTSNSHMIAALVKYAQVRDTSSFDAAIDVYIAWGKTVDSQDRLLLCQAMNDAADRLGSNLNIQFLVTFLIFCRSCRSIFKRFSNPTIVANASWTAVPKAHVSSSFLRSGN